MRPNFQRIILAVLISITFAYSFFNFFFNLEAESFYYDEVVYSLSGLEYLQGDFTRNWEHPFLGKYLMGLSLRLFGKSDFSARLPSALFGFLTGVVIYIFAKEVTNPWCGLAAVCLWSTSPTVLWVSRRAILDAPFVFFFTLSWYLFWRFFQTKSTGHALLGGITLGLAAATKIVGVILVPILFLYLVFPGTAMGEGLPTEPFSPRSGDLRRSKGPKRGFGNPLRAILDPLRPAVLGKLILALAIALLLFLLIYAPVLDRLGPIFRVMNEHWKWEQSTGHREVVNNVIYDKQPWWTYLYWYWRGYPPYLLNYTPGVLVLLGLAMGFALLRGDDIDVFLLLSFLLPFCYLSFYLSFKMFRYADILEPPLAMLAVSFISAVSSFFAKKWKKRSSAYRVALLSLAAVLILAMIHSTWDIQAQEENRYKAAAHHLSPRIKEEETIFVWGYTNVMSWYMGEENEIMGGFNSSGFNGDYHEADYIVVDPLMVSKWPDDPLKTYLEDSQAAYTEDTVGGFELYARRPSESINQ
ncbi:MAG: glycosyltransferase family 39 protein [Anaerolineales bacterium]|nr:glycosyltransferase family 39 protein [Anaerolineales bacterium]